MNEDHLNLDPGICDMIQIDHKMKHEIKPYSRKIVLVGDQKRCLKYFTVNPMERSSYHMKRLLFSC